MSLLDNSSQNMFRFVRMPSMPNSASAVCDLRSAAGNDDPCTWVITLASNESYRAVNVSPVRP